MNNINNQTLYAIIQYHNYRKEHFLRLIGIFDNKDQAYNILKKAAEEYRSTSWAKTSAWIEEINDFDFEKMLNVHLDDYEEESEWMIFIIQKIATSINQEDLKISISYEFPVWVFEGCEPTKCLIKEIFPAKEIKKIVDYSTSSKNDLKGITELFCKKNKNYKYAQF